MGKVIFYGAISLDGYLAGLEDQLDWLFQTDTGVATTYEAFFATIDTTVMGRKTYQEAKKLMDEGPLYPGNDKLCFFPYPKRTAAGCNLSGIGSSCICFSIETREKRMGSGWGFPIKTLTRSGSD